MSAEMETGARKKRGRKKLLFENILKQMEFYFSASNLSKDRWLSNKLNEEESICLTEFLKFNKIKALTDNVKDLAKALRNSEILTVSDDMKVKRTRPIKFKENEEDYMIYIEQVPPDADHEWLRGMFSTYGDIDYISIPKFNNSKKCKGFAFIEFATTQSAEKVIQDFKEKGNYLSTDIAPEELLSIAKYEENDTEFTQDTQGDKIEEESRVACAGSVKEESNSRKRKTSETLESDQEQKKIKTENPSSEGNEDITESEQDEGNPEEIKKKKNRKKKNKKKKYKENAESVGLQILSKKDWRRLRNKYLNMQKEKMKQLKKHLFLAQKKSDSMQNGAGRNRFKKQEPVEEEEKESKAGPQALEFTPGLIVKIKLNEPVIDVKTLKNELKENKSIKYVDTKEGESEVFVRFDSNTAASDFCENSSWPKTRILKGEKESAYWQKLNQQRENKLANKAFKKERGKDKLMKKAENILGKHITFE